MAHFHSRIWAVMALYYYCILASSRLSLAFPTNRRNPNFVTDAQMELAGQELRTYLEMVDNGTVAVTASDQWDYSWPVFDGWPALNFEDVLETCKGRTTTLALTLLDLGRFQIDVATEAFKRQPDTETEAWDWFFMKNHEENPDGWDRNPNTFEAWRAITRNIGIMRMTPREGYSGKGTDLRATKKQVYVSCGPGLGNPNCDRGSWAFVINPDKSDHHTRWELHLCEKFFTLARGARSMLDLMKEDDKVYTYLSDLQTREGILIHEFGHMWNFDYVTNYAPYDPIDPDVPCKITSNGKIYGAECAWKLAWVYQRPKGQESLERPNKAVATCCESYTWWHNKRWWDKNNWNVPLNYKLIPGGGFPHSAVIDGPTSNLTGSAMTWNTSMLGPRQA